MFDGFFDKESRRKQSFACRIFQTPRLAIQYRCIGRQAREIGFGICRIADGVVAIEETGNIKIRTDILDDDIRRVAPAAHCDVAIGQGESIQRHAICAFDHCEACAGGLSETGFVERAHAFQIGGKGIGYRFLARS